MDVYQFVRWTLLAALFLLSLVGTILMLMKGIWVLFCIFFLLAAVSGIVGLLNLRHVRRRDS